MVDRLLGQTESATRPPADLDHDERRGRTRVDRHEIEFVATDMDVPGQDGPTSFRESRRDELFGGITRLLGRRSRRVAGSIRHAGIVAGGTYRRLMKDAPIQAGAVNSSDARSRASSIASSTMTGVSSRASSSWASLDAAGSASKSSSS